MGLVARLASPRTTRAGTDGLRDSLRWREVDSNHPFRRERDGPEERPAADHRRSRDNLRLMTLLQRIAPGSPFANSRETFRKSGTDGSNSLPSSEESSELRYGPRRPACDPYAPYGRFPKRRSCRSTQEGAVADKNAQTVAIIRAGIGGIYLRANWALPASSCASKISMRGTSCSSTATRSLRWLASRYRDIRPRYRQAVSCFCP
jgi:hypothetical protein